VRKKISRFQRDGDFFLWKKFQTFFWPINHNDIAFNYSKRNFIFRIKYLDLSSQGRNF
jgi:hypothetical protein